MAPRCSNSHRRRQPWVLQADGPSLKIRVSSPYRWQLGSGQVSVKVALCRSVLDSVSNRSHPSQKSLRFLPHSAEVWGCHPVRWNLNAAQRSRMLPVCCQSCGLRLTAYRSCSVYPHLMHTHTCIKFITHVIHRHKLTFYSIRSTIAWPRLAFNQTMAPAACFRLWQVTSCDEIDCWPSEPFQFWDWHALSFRVVTGMSTHLSS